MAYTTNLEIDALYQTRLRLMTEADRAYMAGNHDEGARLDKQVHAVNDEIRRLEAEAKGKIAY